MRRRSFGILSLCALLSIFSAAVSAQGERANVRSGGGGREIVISRPGLFRLLNDVRTRNGHGIVVAASNVTLDLGGN